MAAKYQLLADKLREELRRNRGQSGYKLPTELELSRQYQLSRQTVRHTLRLLEEEGLIRRRQGSGSYATGLLPGSPPRQIAVVTSFLDDYIFPAILHDASDVFSRQGYSTTVYATENQVSMERGILLRLLEEPMGGLLVEGTKTALPTPNEDLYRRLCQAGTPIVFLHGAYAGLERIPCVADDNYGGGYQLARPPRDITLADVVSASEDGLELMTCTSDLLACERADGCPSRRVWGGLQNAVNDYLASQTLADIVA